MTVTHSHACGCLEGQPGQGIWGTEVKPPVGSRGKAPVGGLGTKSLEELKQNVKFV